LSTPQTLPPVPPSPGFAGEGTGVRVFAPLAPVPSPAKPGEGGKAPSPPSPLPHSRERGESAAKPADGRLQARPPAVLPATTGDPAEMLDLDMGLDADLGIDSIKRVEILSALQEQLPDAPAVKPEHLGTLHTMRQIVQFLSEPRPSGSGGAAPLPDGRGSEDR